VRGGDYMDKKHTVGKAIFRVILIVSVIGWISEAFTPRCMQSGCDKSPASGSEYCYRHKPSISSRYRRSTGSSSGSGGKHKSSTTSAGSTNKSTTSSTGSTGKSSTTSTGSSTSKSNKSSSSYRTGSSNKKKSSYSNSYDEGYEAIYDDDDYDIDRYNNDSDYGDGVDDAMEDEDW
jgi:hypothetical protein